LNGIKNNPASRRADGKQDTVIVAARREAKNGRPKISFRRAIETLRRAIFPG
jgi:hypothetical protein